MENQVIDQLVEYVRTRFFGKYRGQVKDNKDPTNRGRIKVIVPAVLEELLVWAMPCIPYAGEDMGAFLIPEPGTGVWIEFEGGDPSFPIWTGCFWKDGQLPKDEANNEPSSPLKIIKSEKGLLISFNDESETLTLSDKDGSNIMTIGVLEGKIRMQANLKVVLEAPQIDLVENSTHPLVFGDDLLQYLTQLVQLFNTHMHPGELALGTFPVTPMIPVPMMPPPSPSLLSFKVKTG